MSLEEDYKEVKKELKNYPEIELGEDLEKDLEYLRWTSTIGRKIKSLKKNGISEEKIKELKDLYMSKLYPWAF